MSQIDNHREFIERWASAIMILAGVISGIFFVLVGGILGYVAGRFILAALLISGSLLAFSYTEPRAMRHRKIPLVLEALRFKFLMWFCFGLVWIVRIFGDDAPPQDPWAYTVISFLVGAIAGGIFGLGLLMFLGRRTDIATWKVVRFPIWTVEMTSWLRRRFRQ